MLDDFRQQASESLDEEELPGGYQSQQASRSSMKFLGMTPLQTFIIALLLLLLTCLLSAFCLLVTGKVVPPFLY